MRKWGRKLRSRKKTGLRRATDLLLASGAQEPWNKPIWKK